MSPGQALLADRDAVAQVVGAVMVFALVSMMFVVVRTEFVPEWERQAEADHMDRLLAGMTDLYVHAHRLVMNGSIDSTAVAFESPRPAPWGVLTQDPRAARIAFAPNAAMGSFESSRFLVQVADGVLLLNGTEEWLPFGSGDVVTDIEQVMHLRVRVADPQAQPDGAWARLTIRDATGRYAVDIEVRAQTVPSGYTMKTTIRSATGSVLYDQGESFFRQDQPAHYWVDALRTEAPFGQLLRAATAPLTLVMTEDRLDAEYSIVTSGSEAAGGGLHGSVGALRPNWSYPFESGALLVESRNDRHPDRHLRLESGGMFLVQADGAAERGSPAIEVRRLGGLTQLSVAMPLLRGTWSEHQDAVPVQVGLVVAARSSLEGTAPDWSITVGSPHPEVWATAFRDVAIAGGLSETAGEFTIASGTDWTTWTIYGTLADPSSTVHDLAIDVRWAVVDVRWNR